MEVQRTSTQVPRLLPLKQWAANQGIRYSTAVKRAQYGLMDGRDEWHPQVMQDTTGHWWVAPDGYARVVHNPDADADAVTALVRAEIASHFERFAAQLRGA